MRSDDYTEVNRQNEKTPRSFDRGALLSPEGAIFRGRLEERVCRPFRFPPVLIRLASGLLS